MSISSDTTLTEDHVGNIVITADSVTLNCAGHAITGPGEGTGVLIANRTGVTIKNCEVTGFTAGIEVGSSSATVVKNNHVHDNGFEGIRVGNSDGNTFKDNTVTENGVFGFLVLWSGANTFRSNVVSSQGNSFHFNGSDGNLVVANTAFGGESGYVFIASDGNLAKDNHATGYMCGGYGLSEKSSYNVLRNNVAEAPLINLGSCFPFGFTIHTSSHNELIDNTSTGGTIGFSLDFGATDNTLKGNHAARNSDIQFAIESSGEPLLRSDRNLLANNTAEGGQIGFFLRIASENTLRGNTARFASGNGFLLKDDSNGNTLSNNMSHDNGFAGFFVLQSFAATVDRNTSLDNTAGFLFYFDPKVTDGAASVFSRNTACGNTWHDAADVSPTPNTTWDRNDFCTPVFFEP